MLNVRNNTGGNTKWSARKERPSCVTRFYSGSPISSHFGDCPICFLPHSIDHNEFKLMTCCCNAICVGCAYTNELREREENLYPTCPFCRHPVPANNEESKMILTKRVAVNDPLAFQQMGVRYYEEGDYDTAFGYFTKAAELGDADAHYFLSVLYQEGRGVKRMRKRKKSIRKRLPSPVILLLDIILQ